MSGKLLAMAYLGPCGSFIVEPFLQSSLFLSINTEVFLWYNYLNKDKSLRDLSFMVYGSVLFTEHVEFCRETWKCHVMVATRTTDEISFLSQETAEIKIVLKLLLRVYGF